MEESSNIFYFPELELFFLCPNPTDKTTVWMGLHKIKHTAFSGSLNKQFTPFKATVKDIEILFR